MYRTYSPYKMSGIYFSLCASPQIKISTSHLCLLQSHHILREQIHRYAKKQILSVHLQPVVSRSGIKC